MGGHEFGFMLAVMLGQCFNLSPFGAINILDFEADFAQMLYARWLITDSLGVSNNNGQISWIAAGFSITTGSFVLVGSRLGDIYGHRSVWILALVWWMIWNLDLLAPVITEFLATFGDYKCKGNLEAQEKL
ncbi:hypothetical protein K438DRAFT_1754114 [Mycena galopus ATCC 62051]|nr:hypothetical protein K438DRAFT_1754114 [Mycena galopus ATCC 62051]